MNADLREFLGLLNSAKADYIIVGGIAVAYHGYPRYTGDIDIWIKKSPENASKIKKIITDFGFSDIDLTEKDLQTGKMVFQFGVEPNRIDIITDVDGLDFKDCFSRRIETELDGITVYVLALDDLKINKKSTGRHKDMDDLENLP